MNWCLAALAGYATMKRKRGINAGKTKNRYGISGYIHC